MRKGYKTVLWEGKWYALRTYYMLWFIPLLSDGIDRHGWTWTRAQSILSSCGYDTEVEALAAITQHAENIKESTRSKRFAKALRVAI